MIQDEITRLAEADSEDEGDAVKDDRQPSSPKV